jgi:hypothetical protein
VNIYLYRNSIYSCLKLVILCCALLMGCAASNTSLTGAARQGDISLMKTLISSGANVNNIDSAPLPFMKSMPPLHAAIEAGKVEAVKLLLDSGANPNIRGKNEYTPLFVASVSNQLAIAKLLIEKGADVNAKSKYNETPLILAAQYNHTDIAILLIDSGSNVAVRDYHGQSALNYAKDYHQNQGLIELILKRSDNKDEISLDYSQFNTRDRSINFNKVLVKLSYSGVHTVAIIVQDKRPYIISGKTDPSYVGIFRRTTWGYPWEVTTVDKIPLSKILTLRVAESLQNVGFKPIALIVEPNESTDNIINKIQSAGVKKSILIELKEWQCDTYYRVGLFYDAHLTVMDEKNKIIATSYIKGEDTLGEQIDSDPEFGAKLRIPEATGINLGKLLNSPDVQRALTE